MTICAIDVGSGFTKYSRRDENGKIVSGKFPSIVHVNAQGGLDSSAGIDALDVINVTVSGERMTIGKDILLAGKHCARELHSDYSQTADYEALMLGALYYLDCPEINILMLGLPVNNLSLSNALAKKWKGERKIGKKTIRVNEVMVIPQTMGGLIYKSYLDKKPLDPSQTCMIIDPGYLTVDWIIAKGTKTNTERSNSHYESMRACLKAMAEYVSKDSKSIFDDYERLDECRVHNKTLRVGRKSYEAKQYEGEADPVVDRAMKLMMESIGKIDDLDHVYIVGGGAELYHRGLRRLIKKRKLTNVPVSMVSGMQMANVNGYLLLGEQVHAGRKRQCA